WRVHLGWLVHHISVVLKEFLPRPSELQAPAVRRRAGMPRSVPITASDSTENRPTRRFPVRQILGQPRVTRSRTAPRATRRLRFERIFGPIVFRIAAAHVFTHF